MDMMDTERLCCPPSLGDFVAAFRADQEVEAGGARIGPAGTLSDSVERCPFP